jgi:hypothetical protein
MEPVGLLAPLERSLARILDREPGDDRQDLAGDPCAFDSSTIRAKRGSIGSWASCRRCA